MPAVRDAARGIGVTQAASQGRADSEGNWPVIVAATLVPRVLLQSLGGLASRQQDIAGDDGRCTFGSVAYRSVLSNSRRQARPLSAVLVFMTDREARW